MSGRYPVPAGRHRVEDSIRRSRFITTLDRAADVEAARRVVDDVRSEFPDATHNCWAYLAGPPGTTAHIGMSDDGEPHQTAGRPMLTALLHSGVGEVVAVVTRYYGGVKLGRGGLGRAYSGGVQTALDTLPRARRVTRTPVSVLLDYDTVDPVLRLVEEMGVRRTGEAWGEHARLELAVPDDVLEQFRQALRDRTAGTARVQVRETDGVGEGSTRD